MSLSIEYDKLLLRLRKGDFSQLARLEGLDASWVAKIANGTIRNPGIKKLARLEAALDQLEKPPSGTLEEAA